MPATIAKPAAATASVAYINRRERIAALLQQLNAQLDEHEARHHENPRNYGLVGDLEHVEESLREITSFLTRE